MRWILHRGNRDGPGSCENNPDGIREALRGGFDVEIDLWFVKNQFWLGHDKPEYRIEESFLDLSGLWIHCKDGATFEFMVNRKSNLHFFYHTTEDYVLTSRGYIWCYVGNPLLLGSVAVMPERSREVYNWSLIEKRCSGVCSDYLPVTLRNYLKY
jgi:hypothetical protein